MSNSDSFIEEVTEEVRRDRLFGMLRRYGWIAVVLVIALVAAAAWNEWRKAQDQAAAEAFGDAVLAALEQDDPAERAAALSGVSGNPRQNALVAMLTAEENGEASTEALAALADTAELPQEYRELARLKFVMRNDNGLDPAARLDMLEPLTVAGAPYRLLALEQMALVEVEQGDTDAALTRLQGIMGEDQVSEGLRRRVSQLIIALGGTLDAT